MKLAKGFEDGALGGEIEILVLGEQALEHKLMRSAAAQADIGALVMHDLVVGTVEFRRHPCVSERGQRIGGDSNFIVLADDDESCHGDGRCLAETAHGSSTRSACR